MRGCLSARVKDIRDKAEAMAAYARQAKDQELIQYATEIKVRAERRCGELLRATERAPGAKGVGTSAVERHDTTHQTLAEMGLTRDESSRYQQLAAMPEEHFETAVATAKATAGEVTTAFMLRQAASVRTDGSSDQRTPAVKHQLVKRLRHRPNLEVQRAVHALAGICSALDRIDPSDAIPASERTPPTLDR